jgi:hypothetical protein
MDGFWPRTQECNPVLTKKQIRLYNKNDHIEAGKFCLLGAVGVPQIPVTTITKEAQQEKWPKNWIISFPFH